MLPPANLEVYDMKNDPSETTYVAARNPDVVKRLAALMTQQHVPSAVFPMRALDNAP